jgi:hypothetical protein
VSNVNQSSISNINSGFISNAIFSSQVLLSNFTLGRVSQIFVVENDITIMDVTITKNAAIEVKGGEEGEFRNPGLAKM